MKRIDWQTLGGCLIVMMLCMGAAPFLASASARPSVVRDNELKLKLRRGVEELVDLIDAQGKTIEAQGKEIKDLKDRVKKLER